MARLFGRLSRGLTCLLLWSVALGAQAQCDPSNFVNLVARRVGPKQAPVTVSSTAINEGSASVSIPLDVGSGLAGLSLSDGGIGTVVRVPVSDRWTWQLVVRRAGNANIGAGDIEATYSVSNGGFLISEVDSSSRIRATIETSRLETVTDRGALIVRGFIDLLLDLTEATRAGDYNGRITIEASCR